MAKNKKFEKVSQPTNNAYLVAKQENGFINFELDVKDIKGVKVRLITPNRKLAYKLYCRLNGKK